MCLNFSVCFILLISTHFSARMTSNHAHLPKWTTCAGHVRTFLSLRLQYNLHSFNSEEPSAHVLLSYVKNEYRRRCLSLDDCLVLQSQCRLPYSKAVRVSRIHPGPAVASQKQSRPWCRICFLEIQKVSTRRLWLSAVSTRQGRPSDMGPLNSTSSTKLRMEA